MGFELDAFLLTSLVDMYSKCGQLRDARFLFDDMWEKDVPVWNNAHSVKFLIVSLLKVPNISYAHKLFDLIPQRKTPFLYNKLIQAYSSHGPYTQCLTLYEQMRLQNCPPNPHTFTFLFSACASLSSLKQGQKIHTHLLRMGFEFDVFSLTSLVDMYSKCGQLRDARFLFDDMWEKDVPVCNSMMAGYMKSGDVEGARELFDLMGMRNVVSWTTMVSGYSQNGQYEDALEMYVKMEKERECRPNEVTITSVIITCANLGALATGERIEKYARERGFMQNLFVSNALIEMYAKCGRIDAARVVFNEIGRRRNLCSWNSIITGLAVHGRSLEGLELYNEMLMRGTKPDDITFVGVLLACAHGCGLVKKGWQIFNSMEKNFNVTPKLQHYGCMVDLLGRAGELSQAYELIKGMPFKPDSIVWGALLGSCSFYGNVEFAEKAAEALFELEPWNPGVYVILSNIYASAGQWDGVSKTWKLMKGNKVKKIAGYSFVEVDGTVHKFTVEDRSHEGSYEIFALLDEISSKTKLLRYEADLNPEIDDQT
ncbi:hypothetical protein GIB67_000916 [Kingdonia uniflora]|uniref:Pentatricopeptide repeat-containing protein n=1 Tax=Kingdonia uniflora TaxID=39325 RepID=A0A7J7MFJ7_9MAGN|nr:hypothetical protein GIB67_000916 [Kingdonia uniflora]